jgi:HEPN domain-containing protein
VAKSKHVRLFVKTSLRFRGDAEVLLENGRSHGAIYMGGYAVECVLKALILVAFDAYEQPAKIDEFKGKLAHNLQWLREEYVRAGGARIPKPVQRAFQVLDDWNTDLRYNPDVNYSGDAAIFFRELGVVMEWALRRVG